jgi:hypothetical protein
LLNQTSRSARTLYLLFITKRLGLCLYQIRSLEPFWNENLARRMIRCSVFILTPRIIKVLYEWNRSHRLTLFYLKIEMWFAYLWTFHEKTLSSRNLASFENELLIDAFLSVSPIYFDIFPMENAQDWSAKWGVQDITLFIEAFLFRFFGYLIEIAHFFYFLIHLIVAKRNGERKFLHIHFFDLSFIIALKNSWIRIN